MTARAMKVCAVPGCARLTHTSRCDEHTPKPWASSTTRANRQTGRALQATRSRIHRRDAGHCYRCGSPAGDHWAVDHVTPMAEGGTDTDQNRAVICEPCHRIKSAAESARGRERNR